MNGISIVVTTYNEGQNIRDLLASLIIQEQPIEIIVVDSESADSTPHILEEYSKKYNYVKYINKKCTRGEGRNIGVKNSKYDCVAFIDGDSIASDSWIKNIKNNENYDIIAGKIISVGNKKYETERMELFYKNFDVTSPSSNLIYSKSLFLDLGGFDENFITAEDIDMNIRAMDKNPKFIYCEDCIVYNKTRNNMASFIKQAFWNGYGRKQLKNKHGKIKQIHKNQFKLMLRARYLIRNFFGSLGFLYCTLKRK